MPIKAILGTIIILALLAFAYWYSQHQYQAGYDAAKGEDAIAAENARKLFDKKKNDLINVHLAQMKKVKHATAATINAIRRAQDQCLDHDMPAVVLDRVRRERTARDNLPD